MDQPLARESVDFAGFQVLRPEEDDRRRNTRRTLVAIAVVIFHLIALAVLVYSSRIQPPRFVKQTIPEMIMWFPFHKHEPVVPTFIRPQIEVPIPIITLPITIPPLELTRPTPLPPPPTEGLLGVGRSLACGASSYEYLPPAMRDDCLRHPWHFAKLPDGTIVLDTRPDETEPTAAEIARHDREMLPPLPNPTGRPSNDDVVRGYHGPLP